MKTQQNPIEMKRKLRDFGPENEGYPDAEKTISTPNSPILDYLDKELIDPELPYERNYSKNTLQGSSSLLKIIRGLQPTLLAGKKHQIAIINLIEKYVTNDYNNALQEREGYELLKQVLTSDLLVTVKGLRLIAIRENVPRLDKIDAAVKQNASIALETAKTKLEKLKKKNCVLKNQ